MTLKKLICLSHIPWQAAPSRAQQLLIRMRDVDILFFEPPRSAPARDARRGRRVRPNLTVYTLPPLRSEDGPALLRRRGQARLGAFVLDVMDRHRFRDALLWVTSPDNLFLLDAIPYRGLVYDCDREWDELPLEWESELAVRADVCFAASPGLACRLSPCCDNIAVIPNGVNELLYRQEPSPPAELRRAPGPTLCRVGEVAAGLDLEPLRQTALRRPSWRFFLLGQAGRWAERALEQCPNVRFLGRVPAAEVPDYLLSCDICFDLLSRQTRGSDILPAHIYEYLASGRPVVAMLDEDQVEPYPDVVYTAHNPAQFLSCCEHALMEDPTWVSQRRRGYAHAARWSRRAAEVVRILEAAGLL